jgi:hypothetical protein
VPRGLQVIEKELQTQVHPSAAGPNPIAQKWKKNLKLYSPQTVPVPAVPRGLQVIHKIKETQVPQSAAGPNPVAWEWEEIL